MKNKLKVLMIPSLNSGVTFWRLFNFWPAAYRNHIADFHVLWWQKDLTEAHPWQRDIGDMMHVFRITKEIQDWALQSDAIVFQMLTCWDGFHLFEAVKELCPDTPVFSEIDDNMLSTPIYNAADQYYQPGSEPRKIALAQFKASDGIIVSTPYLKEVYSEFNPNISVIPNCIDFQTWDKVRHGTKPGIRIGWAGGYNHEADLKIVEPVIYEIAKRHKDVKFVFVHGLPTSMRTLPNVIPVQKWTRIDRYPQFMASMDLDIGIAPLVDNAFNRSKSNLRFLEHSALGIPTVASKVGHFAETITHGKDGFLAETTEEWVNCLETLITNRQLRKEMGRRANQTIRHKFNVDFVTKDYVSALEEAIKRKGVKNESINADGLCGSIR